MTRKDQPTKDEPGLPLPDLAAGEEAEEATSSRSRVDWSRSVTTGIKVAIVALVASVALGFAAFAAASSYTQYGAVKNAPNTHAWSGLTPQFAGQAICASCHAPEARYPGCQHPRQRLLRGLPRTPRGPRRQQRRGRSASSPPSRQRQICATCHAAVAGSPGDVPADRSRPGTTAAVTASAATTRTRSWRSGRRP